jgi:hypothetical protein
VSTPLSRAAWRYGSGFLVVVALVMLAMDFPKFIWYLISD